MSSALSSYIRNLSIDNTVITSVSFDGLANSEDINIEYKDRTIWLSSGNEHVTSVDCGDFIKDGMLSSAELCGTTLILKFNTDVVSDDISVELSDIIDDYDDRIKYLSDCISANTENLSSKASLDDLSSYEPISSLYNDVSSIVLSSAESEWVVVEDGGGWELCSGPYYIGVQDGWEAEFYKNGHGGPMNAGGDENATRLVFYNSEDVIVIEKKQGGANILGIVTYDYLSSNMINYLDKRIGGEISGDVAILSSNYLQSTTPDLVKNFSAKNSFLQAEYVPEYGIAYTGSRGYCIISADSVGNRLQLSGDISLLKQICDGEKTTGNITDGTYQLTSSLALKVILGKDPGPNRIGVGSNLSSARFSIALSSESTPSYYTLKNVDENTGWVTLNEQLSVYKLNKFDGLNPDFFTVDTWLNDDNAFYLVGFPEVGNQNIRNFYGNHIEGGSTRAIGKYAHAEGRDTIASMRYAHAEGAHTIADEMAAHAEGFGTVALARHAHSEGFYTTASGKYAHAEGSYSKAIGFTSHAEGLSSIAKSDEAHAEGNATSAFGAYSHTEGIATYASNTAAHSEGSNTKATGPQAHAEGYFTQATGNYSHAEGRGSQANADGSHAAGIKAKALSEHKFAWCWNGLSSNDYYDSKGEGTFCINPLSGLSGFYIGEQNLEEIISARAGGLVQNTIKDALTDLGITKNTLSSDIDMGQVYQFITKLASVLL